MSRNGQPDGRDGGVGGGRRRRNAKLCIEIKIDNNIFVSHGREICTRELFLDIYQTLYKWLAHVRSIGLVTRLIYSLFGLYFLVDGHANLGNSLLFLIDSHHLDFKLSIH